MIVSPLFKILSLEDIVTGLAMCESLKPVDEDEPSSVPRERRAEIHFNRAKHLGSMEAGDCGSSPLIKPDWFNEELFNKAQQLAKHRFCSLFFGHLCGLCMLVHVPSILTPLLSTNNSRTIGDIFVRYLGTLSHVKRWYEGDIWDPSSEAHQSIMTVRKMHERVAKKLNGNKVPSQETLYLSAYDMFLTQFGFIGMLILHPKECGLVDDEQNEQIKALIHYWRCVGYLLGIDDQFNLFTNEDDYQLIRCMCNVIMEQEFRPTITKYSSEESKLMSRSIVEAIKAVVPPLSVRGFTNYLYKMNTLDLPVEMSGMAKAGYHGINFTMKRLMPNSKMAFVFDKLLRRAIKKAQKRQEVIKQRLSSRDVVIEGNFITDVGAFKSF